MHLHNQNTPGGLKPVHLRLWLRGVALCTMAIVLQHSAHTQGTQIEFFNTVDGLSDNRVWSVDQDSDGFLWIMANGLNRFVGKEFQHHGNQVSPPFRQFKDIVQFKTSENEVVFLDDGQLKRLDIRSGHFDSLDLYKSSQYVPPASFGLIESPGDTVYIGARKNDSLKLLTYYQGTLTARTMTKGTGPNQNQHLIAAINRAGELTIFNYLNANLVTMNSDGEVVSIIKYPNTTPQFYLTTDRKGRKLVNISNQVYVLDLVDNKLRTHEVNTFLGDFGYIYGLFETANGDLWISGPNCNLGVYRAKTNSFYNYQKEIIENIIHRTDFGRIFMDDNGVIWACSVMGLLKLTVHETIFDRYLYESEEICNGYCSFRGITEDSAGIIYAGYYNNVVQITPGSGITRKAILNKSNTPFDLSFFNGRLILNSGNQADPESGKVIDPYPASFGLGEHGIHATDGNGRFWVAQVETIKTINFTEENPEWEKAVSPLKDRFTDIRYDSDRQSLWMLTVNQVREYKTDGGRLLLVDSIPVPDPIIPRYLCILRNILWIGTSNGLIRYDPGNRTSKLFTTSDGLCHNNVVTILAEGDSCLWLGTHGGLSRFHLPSEQFINFHKVDGLANEEFNRRSAHAARNGKMYFGGITGITSFYPDDVMHRVRRIQNRGKLAFTQFSKHDKRDNSWHVSPFVESGSTVHIYPRNRIISVDYSLLDYRHLDKALYSYKLAGINDNWTKPSGERKINLTDLNSGSYTLQIKALTHRGEWYPDQLTLNIISHPPWWATWWAYGGYAILTGVLITAIFLFLKRRWALQNALQLEHQKSERLKELNTFKSQLYTNITHEFRTPLTVILGMQESIKESWENADRKEKKSGINKSLDLIRDNGKNLLFLINQLLDLSKLENKAFKLTLYKGDIISYLRYITHSLQTLANNKNLSLRFSTTSEKLVMDFDPEQMKQIMINLISNAIKFTPDGGDVVVHVEESDDSVNIEITDNGIGIAEKDLPYIFDRFYQVDRTATRTSEGSGIGLAHTNHLIQVMGGAVSVQSTLDKGTTFAVRLPVTNAPDTPLSSPENTDTINGIPSAASINTEENQPDLMSEDPVVLVIEDNADVVFYLRSCLEGTYQVIVAYNGQIGIDKALEIIPDIVISDVMMPEKDGFEVCDTLKNDIRTSHIPVILLTARADAGSRLDGLRYGADAYLSKPFHREELMVRMESMIRQKERIAEYFREQRENHISAHAPVPDITLLREQTFIDQVHAIVEEHYGDENFSLPDLCHAIGMSRSQLYRKMKAILDTSPSDYIRNYRIDQARQLLLSSDLTVSEVAWKVGFKYLPHFSKAFQDTYGVSPSNFGK